MSEPDIPWGYLQANLVTLADVARRYNITRGMATLWAQEKEFPGPVLVFSAHSGTGVTRYYWAPAIKAWYNRRQPARRGRPGGRHAARDAEIIRLSATQSRRDLAEAYGLSYQRIQQIISGARLTLPACRFYRVGWGLSPPPHSRRTHARRRPDARADRPG